MKKRYVVIALTALIVFAALLALLLRGGGESDPIDPAAPTADASSPSSSNADAVQTQAAQQPDHESEQQETAAPDAAKIYNFLTWQDALDEYARWMGNEYERLKAEGHPDPGFQADHNFTWGDDDSEIAALKKAMDRFIPIPPGLPGMSKKERDSWNATAIPWEIWKDHRWVLVWAGKLPGGSRYPMISLPNGDVFPLERNHQLRATYRTRTPPRSRTEEGARKLESLLQRRSALFTALINAQDAEFDSIAEELKKVKKSITALQSPTISSPRIFTAGKDDTYRIIELDLGIVDIAHEDQ